MQRCLRTTDLEEVGDATHLTVFQMLGSWSLGDYDGSQSLRWGYELLTDGFGVEPGRLHATVFGGDDAGRAGPGLAARSGPSWASRSSALVEDNWWSNGPAGPCGPDSEIFVWVGDGPPRGTPSTDDRWVEVWNHVMLRCTGIRTARSSPLPQPNVDTGMGLERMIMVLQGRSSVYETDLFEPWVRDVRELWALDGTDLRLVVDHLRSSVVVSATESCRRAPDAGTCCAGCSVAALTTLWRLDDDPDDVRPAGRPDHQHAGPLRAGASILRTVRQVILDEEQPVPRRWSGVADHSSSGSASDLRTG